MKQPITLIILALLTTTPASADTPPARIVGSEQQANRDNEKLNILKNEIKEQQQLAAQLQQQRAIDLKTTTRRNSPKPRPGWKK